MSFLLHFPMPSGLPNTICPTILIQSRRQNQTSTNYTHSFEVGSSASERLLNLNHTPAFLSKAILTPLRIPITLDEL